MVLSISSVEVIVRGRVRGTSSAIALLEGRCWRSAVGMAVVVGSSCSMEGAIAVGCRCRRADATQVVCPMGVYESRDKSRVVSEERMGKVVGKTKVWRGSMWMMAEELHPATTGLIDTGGAT